MGIINLIIGTQIINTFLSIDNNETKASISKSTDLFMSTVFKHLNVLRDNGLISIETKGRKCIVTYTDRGIQLRNKLIELDKI